MKNITSKASNSSNQNLSNSANDPVKDNTNGSRTEKMNAISQQQIGQLRSKTKNKGAKLTRLVSKKEEIKRILSRGYYEKTTPNGIQHLKLDPIEKEHLRIQLCKVDSEMYDTKVVLNEIKKSLKLGLTMNKKVEMQKLRTKKLQHQSSAQLKSFKNILDKVYSTERVDDLKQINDLLEVQNNSDATKLLLAILNTNSIRHIKTQNRRAKSVKIEDETVQNLLRYISGFNFGTRTDSFVA